MRISGWSSDVCSSDLIKNYALYKSIGISVLALVLLRLVWRLFAGPAPVAPGPRWQQRAAAITHVGLYALMLAIPLSGWAFNSASILHCAGLAGSICRGWWLPIRG